VGAMLDTATGSPISFFDGKYVGCTSVPNNAISGWDAGGGDEILCYCITYP
jgi:hypothetical protein